MKEENLIYIKLENREVRQSKKDILIAESNFLKILQTMKRYHPIRIEELNIKTRMHLKISEILKNIKKLEVSLPQIKIPKILQGHYPEEAGQFEEIEEKIEKAKTKQYDSEIESQLQEIKDRLKELSK